MRILSSLVSKLQDQSSPCLLVGVRLGGTTQQQLVLVDVVNVTTAQEGHAVTLHPATEQLLPHGLSYVGVWSQTQASALQLLQEKQVMHALGPARLPGVLAYRSGTEAAMHEVLLGASLSETSLPPPATPSLLQVQVDQPLAWISELGLCLIRCRASLQLSVFTQATAHGSQAHQAAAWPQAVTAAVQELEAQLSDPQVLFVLTNSDGTQATSSSPGAVSSLRGDLDVPCEASAMALQPPPSSHPAASPVFEYQPADPGPVQQHSCSVELDALAHVPRSLPLADLPAGVFQPALRAQLQVWRAAAVEAGTLRQLTPRHFAPPGRLHHVALCYPTVKPDAEMNEAALAPLRRQLHALLGLPADRPALRASNALAWQAKAPAAAAGQGERLCDVHLGLPAPGPSPGAVHLLQGSYEYFHYMQDRIDDSGWGCAYRSLQTICSWFRLQRYSAKPSPSHREIQQALVRIGDKEPSFVGSKQWIGAIELSYILDDYLGVTCKIITINRGADIPSHARELVVHFKTQGTPVMIGGGVLAYTLLGVYFDESTGDCAFLILDPHYTGTEALGRIHKGAWVGWKRPGELAAAGGPLFVQDAFYNFLCPQRPKEV